MVEKMLERRGWNEAIEACLAAVEAEEEPSGPMPDALHLVPVEDAMLAAVRATKRGIRERIEKLSR